MSQLHASIISTSTCWESTQDNLPKDLKTRVFSKEIRAASTVACSCCCVKQRPHACHAQQENDFSLSTVSVSHGAFWRAMTLFLGYFLLLLPK